MFTMIQARARFEERFPEFRNKARAYRRRVIGFPRGEFCCRYCLVLGGRLSCNSTGVAPGLR